MNYLKRKRLSIMRMVEGVKGFIRTISGASPLILPNCVDEDSLINYTISGNSIQSMLPKGYQSVEYIESSGTQYIDTEVIANQNTGFEIEFLTKSIIGMSGYGSIFGARLGSANTEFHLTTYGSTNSQGTFRFETKSTNGGIQAEGKSKISLKNGIYTTSNGDEIALADVTVETPCSITIFALNQNSTITQYSKTQLFSFKLYDGDVLIRDFIPCCRLIDNVVGLYDLVNDKFYLNKGTGVFLKGSDTPGNPTPEAPIDVESVGDTTVNLFDKSLSSAAGISDETVFKGYGVLVYSNEKVLKILKPDTKYTITYKVEMVSTPSDTPVQANFNPIGLALYSGVSGYTNLSFYKVTGHNLTPGSVYEFKQTFTTPSNLMDSNANYRMIGYSGRYLMDDSTSSPGTVILSKIQIEEGDIATSYEPYGYKIPIKVIGKNLYNPTKTNYVKNGVTFIRNTDSTFTVNTDGAATANTYFHIGDKFVVDPTKKYYLSGGTEKLKIGVQLFGGTGTTQLTTISVNKGLIELPTSVVGVPIKYFNVVLNVKSGDVCENEIMKPMISHIETDEYEPYVEPITTNIYLDEPLRKILDYADYIDFEKQKVVRNIGETNVTATAVGTTDEEDEMASFYFRIADKRAISDSYIVQVLSSKLLGAERIKLSSLDIPCIISNTSGTVVYFRLPKTLIGGTTTVLANAYLKSNPTTVYYIKDTPTETDIVLPKLPTFKGTTVYSADTKINPSNMSATYYSSVKGE